MLYVIYGEQPFTIQNRYKKIAKEALGEIDQLNYVRLDMGEISYQDLIDEATLIPLGYDKKVVVVENCLFLAKETKSLRENKEYKEFLAFLRNIDDSLILILTLYQIDVDTKSAVLATANEYGKVLALTPVTEDQWKDYVEQYILKHDIHIDIDALNELTKRTAGDVALFRNTIDKLTLYTDHITYKDINLMVVKPLEENIFLIYNNLISKKNDLAIKVYRDLIAQNVEPITIIGTLAKQFRLLHQIKYLVKEKKTNKDIASILNIKESRATVIMRQTYSIDEKIIRGALEDLYQLDYQIKSGQVDRHYALELFLIKFNKD